MTSVMPRSGHEHDGNVPEPDDDGTARPRTVVAGGSGRQRAVRWPSGRALLGAVLVVVAAAGVLSAHRAASQPPTTRWVVATRDVPAGAVLRADDLGTVAVDLPSGIGAVAGSDAEQVVGAVTLRPLRDMDLLRPTDVGDPAETPSAGSVEVPVEVDRGRSMSGSIHSGSRVDVLTTDPDGGGTTTIAQDVLVVSTEEPDADGIGSTDAVRYRLALPDRESATAVVDASVRSHLTLVLPDPGADRG